MKQEGEDRNAIAYFGIRHHGPGSANSLIQALDELKPVAVLIEGPADATDVLPMLAKPEMKPPVALLCYPEDNPSLTSFWPFAEFSPEYQAVLWAVQHGVDVRFIDLPSTVRFDMQQKLQDETINEEKPEEETEEPDEKSLIQETPEARDPIGTLAAAAGYEDGESWWADLIEQNPAPGPVFKAIAEAMTVLRENEGTLPEFEAKREGHMRLSIAAARKEFEGPIAVVCGAWHVPALVAKHTQKEDQALVKGISRKKSSITWAPWTSPRLAFAFGYGAGVTAPGWCQCIWQNRHRSDCSSVWLAQIARVLREKGHMISTASLIETERLALSLAAIRERPRPGFEELREAAVAGLFNGESLLWQTIEAELLLGNNVGEIPSDIPLAPLMDDLQRNQKLARLKPEALERELSIDLRSDSGLFRSTLLHRLTILGVPWGRLTDTGRSRGTFRERWVVSWEPEYAVQLVEKLVYGPTIEKAANGYVIEQLDKATTLDALAELVQSAITADLKEAATRGLIVFEERAALSSDCREMLASIPPMADIIRYGEARASDTGRLSNLMERLIVEAAIALPYATRDLDAEATTQMVTVLRAADEGVRLVEPGPEVLEAWYDGLKNTLEETRVSPRVAGCVAQILYEADHLSAEEAVLLLERRLSPGTPVLDAAGFLEGFFSGTAEKLIYDEGLRKAVDQWLYQLAEEDFVAHLPLMRRVFSSLDSMERKRLITALLGKGSALPSTFVPAPDKGEGWKRHFAILQKTLQSGEMK